MPQALSARCLSHACLTPASIQTLNQPSVMGEILGATSAIAGLISLSGAVLAEGHSFLGTVYRAPRELRQLLSETAALDSVTGQLQGLADDAEVVGAGSKSALSELGNSGVLYECKESLLSVRKSIAVCEQVTGLRVRNPGEMIIWSFKEKETKDALARVSRLRDLLNTAIAADTR